MTGNEYTYALTKAGATLLDCNEFGSYQGDWWALVEYRGVTGWVHGRYGSCTGCDAFKSEFGYSSAENDPEYDKKIIAFGKSYLDSIMSQSQAVAEAGSNSDWDAEADDMVRWIVRVGTAAGL